VSITRHTDSVKEDLYELHYCHATLTLTLTLSFITHLRLLAE